MFIYQTGAADFFNSLFFGTIFCSYYDVYLRKQGCALFPYQGDRKIRFIC